MLDRAALACELARQAGIAIRDAMGAGRRVEYKSAVDLVTDVDRRAQAIVVDGLRKAFPNDAIVAEEDDAHAPSQGPCWYVDPLDGTTNFVHGLPHFAVSVAYFDKGRPEAAAVYDPCKDELFRAARGRGAWLGRGGDGACGGQRLGVSTVSALDRALLVTGFPYDRRDHAPAYLEYFREFLCRAQDLRRYGSASLDLCYVACGRFDGFWEWKLHPWDTAAGWLVVEEAGGRVSDFDGSSYDPWLPRILATNAVVHDEAMAVLAQVGAGLASR